MKNIKSAAAIFAFALVFGLVFFGQASSAIAQGKSVQHDKKEKKIKKQDNEDEDNDGDDVSADEAKRASISLDAACAIALEKVNGAVIDEELEKEHGRLQYAFDIRDSKGQVYDVEIDAVTGEVLQAILDEDDDDAAKKVTKKKVVERTAKVVKTKPH